MQEARQNPVSSAWFLVGATAVGKTGVAQYVAERTGAAILSVDAMLVYRGMDIGTAKPSVVERGAVPYFGIDLADPDEPFSTGNWLQGVRAQLAAARELVFAQPGVAGSGVLAVGGTGLYVRALTQGLEAAAADPARRQYWQERLAREGLASLQRELAARVPAAIVAGMDEKNPRRVIRALEHLEQYGALPAGWRAEALPRVVGLRLPRAALHIRIAARVAQMFDHGLLAEVEALRRHYPVWQRPRGDASAGGASAVPSEITGGAAGGVATACQAIGYAEVCDLLDKRITREQAIEQMVIRTRQLAKRQETWFRHQAEVTWLDLAPDEPLAAVGARVLAAWSEHGPTPIRLF
jgi:tRNA dimethylallyltransferase